MKCQKCGKHEASIYITETINGVKSEAYLCNLCADSDKSYSSYSPFDADFGSFFQSVLGMSDSYQKSTFNNSVCPICKSSLSDIQKSGRIGCSECYSTFRGQLLRLLKEIHGSNLHSGKVPKRLGQGRKKANKLEELKDELSRAVLDQNFEKAAELRDRIREIEGKAV